MQNAASHRRARTLLEAWRAADVPKIHSAIAQAQSAADLPLASEEAERMELVQEAGLLIREWMQGKRTAIDLEAGLTVLRHMAHGNVAAREPVPFR